MLLLLRRRLVACGHAACGSAHLLVQARHLGHGAVVGLLQVAQQLQMCCGERHLHVQQSVLLSPHA